MAFQILNGLIAGLLYSLVALGFSLIYSGAKVFHCFVLHNRLALTRGPYGIPKPSLLGIKIDSLLSFSLLGFAVACLIAGFLALIFRSPFGRTIHNPLSQIFA